VWSWEYAVLQRATRWGSWLGGKSTDGGMADDITWVPIGDYEVFYNADRVGERFGLSPRETQALALFAIGLTSSAIKRQMNVGDSTLNTFKRRIVTKLGVRTVAAATALFMASATGARIRKRTN